MAYPKAFLRSLKITGIYRVFCLKDLLHNTQIKCSTYTPVWRLLESDFAQLE